jgi:hypothetical protein
MTLLTGDPCKTDSARRVAHPWPNVASSKAIAHSEQRQRAEPQGSCFVVVASGCFYDEI